MGKVETFYFLRYYSIGQCSEDSSLRLKKSNKSLQDLIFFENRRNSLEDFSFLLLL